MICHLQQFIVAQKINIIFFIFFSFIFSIKITSLSLSFSLFFLHIGSLSFFLSLTFFRLSRLLLVILSLTVVCGFGLVRGPIFDFALLSNRIFGNPMVELRWSDLLSNRIFVGSSWVFFQVVVVMQ